MPTNLQRSYGPIKDNKFWDTGPHIHLYHLFTLDWMISGARYSGVPHSVQVLSVIFLAKPKSVIIKWPSWKGIF